MERYEGLWRSKAYEFLIRDFENATSRLCPKGQAEGCIRSDLDADALALMVGSLQIGLTMQQLVDPTMNL
jgi:hypothetical protein